MKKITINCLLAVFAYTTAYSQDTVKPTVKKLPPYVLNGGRYNITIDNGKMTAVKNPNFDESKVLKRQLPHDNFTQKFEIFVDGSNTPIIKKHFIDDLNSESSVTSLTKQERMAKYGSREPVEIVHLKSGVIIFTAEQLFTKFKVTKENAGLPLYLDYRPIKNPEELMGVPDAIFKIEVVTDSDGVRFLNIMTKEWKEQNDKYPNQVYIR